MLRAHGVTDKGRVRSTNEDAFAIDLDLGLCIVADGMGGHKAGEVASQLAVKVAVDWMRRTGPDEWPYGLDPECSRTGNLLKTAIHAANRAVFDLAGSNVDYEGMGTTIVAVVVRGALLSVAHAGDSRLYLSGPEGFRQLTEDDSWMTQVLARDPGADPEALRHHPMRHALTNVVGARSEMTVTLREHALTDAAQLLLTTDGVHGALDAVRLEDLLREGGDGLSIASRLVEAALAAGSRDNCTVVMAEYLPE